MHRIDAEPVATPFGALRWPSQPRRTILHASRIDVFLVEVFLVLVRRPRRHRLDSDNFHAPVGRLATQWTLLPSTCQDVFAALFAHTEVPAGNKRVALLQVEAHHALVLPFLVIGASANQFCTVCCFSFSCSILRKDAPSVHVVTETEGRRHNHSGGCPAPAASGSGNPRTIRRPR